MCVALFQVRVHLPIWSRSHAYIYLRLARTVYIRMYTRYIWWFPRQKLRMYTVDTWFWLTLHLFACEHAVGPWRTRSVRNDCMCSPTASSFSASQQCFLYTKWRLYIQWLAPTISKEWELLNFSPWHTHTPHQMTSAVQPTHPSQLFSNHLCTNDDFSNDFCVSNKLLPAHL